MVETYEIGHEKIYRSAGEALCSHFSMISEGAPNRSRFDSLVKLNYPDQLRYSDWHSMLKKIGCGRSRDHDLGSRKAVQAICNFCTEHLTAFRSQSFVFWGHLRLVLDGIDPQTKDWREFRTAHVAVFESCTLTLSDGYTMLSPV